LKTHFLPRLLKKALPSEAKTLASKAGRIAILRAEKVPSA